MPARFRRAIALALLLPASLSAQGAPGHQLQLATRNSLAVEINEMVSISGSLEFVLVGVSALTDTQRDSIERIDRELRDTMLRHATPMLRARPSLTPWRSAEQVLFERDVNAIIRAHIRAMDRLRDVMTRDQQRVFERNDLALRDFDLRYWDSYARGASSLATLDAVTTP